MDQRGPRLPRSVLSITIADNSFEFQLDRAFDPILRASARPAICFHSSLGSLLIAGSGRPRSRRPVRPARQDHTCFSDSPSETRLQLRSSPRANGFAPVGNDVNRPALGLALTARGSRRGHPAGPQGPGPPDQLRTGRDHPHHAFLGHFGRERQRIPSGDKTIDVTVSTGAPAVVVKAESAGVVASRRPAADGLHARATAYELVQLKYADVSGDRRPAEPGRDGQVERLVHPPRAGVRIEQPDRQPPIIPGRARQAPGSDDTPLGQSVDAAWRSTAASTPSGCAARPITSPRMKAMIAAIDIPLDSVMLETQFVELTETGSKALGIDFTNSNGQIGVVTVQIGPSYHARLPAQGCNATAQLLRALTSAQSRPRSTPRSRRATAGSSPSRASPRRADRPPRSSPATRFRS